MEHPKICLNMIVKNESHIIEKTLMNLYDKIKLSYYVICDTGSNDNTKQIIKKFFDKKNISGELYDHEWKDFGYNRTKALECAFNKSDYLFIFDADDSIVGDFKIPSILNFDIYRLKFGINFIYYRPLLINNKKKFKFSGILHEFLDSSETNLSTTNLNGDYYIISGRSGNRNKESNKYLNDSIKLEKAYNDISGSNKNLAQRYVFYCAQSYKDAGITDKAIEWYEKCLKLDNWNQEKYYSCLMLSDLYKKKNDSYSSLKFAIKSSEYDNNRIEGIVKACEQCMHDGLHSIVYGLYQQYKHVKLPDDRLFLSFDLYNDHLLYYASISSYYLKKEDISYQISKILLNNNKIDTIKKFNVLTNLIFLKKQILEDDSISFFNRLSSIFEEDNQFVFKETIEIWNILFNKWRTNLTKYNNFEFINVKNPIVFLSFTTCKRIDLFKQTINSILNQIEDICLIDYWFCVDDNSCQEDRKEMNKLYPWIDYYMKTFEEKGHRKSMNIIYKKLEELNPKYWFHLEDDFLFFDKISIKKVLDSFNLLEKNNVKQILFNRNYAETISEYNIKGHQTTNNKNLVLHLHKNDSAEYLNCHYWPHFSFRPSIIDVEAILKLGDFNSENQFFEMDYAKKYNSAGYKSGFLNKISNIHIGKLTSQQGTEYKNAYLLNNEEQFKNKKCFIKIVNLERRQDRKEYIEKLFRENKIEKYNFFKAVDGKKLQPNLNLAKLFKNNDFNSKKGVIGCALSHLNLWKELLKDKDNDFYIIFEDDIEVCDNFNKKLLNLYSEMKNKEYILLGYHMFEERRKNVHSIYKNEKEVTINKLDKDLYIGGTFGYSINKQGAKILVDYINKNGIKHGIDYLIKIIPELKSYECQPQLVFSEWNENGKQIDSDIQNLSQVFDFSVYLEEEKINENFYYFKGLDQFDFDLYFSKDDIFDQKIKCLNDEDCNCFNSLGFFKSDVLILKKSPYFSENDGIYVKKSYLDILGYDLLNPPNNLDKVFKNYNPHKFCFIHSCHVDSTGLKLLDNLINCLKETKAINIFHTIFIINIGLPINDEYSNYENICVINFSSNVHLYEIKTINLIYFFSILNPNSQLLYIHTIGILNNNNNIEDWVNMMLYFLVKKHETCIKYLETLDTLGCNYIVSNDVKPHFSGNYWWANTNYLLTLKPIKTNVRHDAEWWLMTNPNLKFKCLHHSMVNHYEENYPRKKYERTRIKMMCNWCSSKSLCNTWKNMCTKDYSWKDIEITWEDTDIDYYVIINYPLTNDYFDKSRTIVFQMEPWVNDESKKWGVKTWGIWAEPNKNDFMAVIGRHSNTYNNVFWQLKLTVNQLNCLEYNKEDVVSCVTSNKYFDEGHIARIDFLKFLEKKKDFPLKIFGNVEEIGFKNYEGRLEPENKGEGIVPYKYYFMVENNYEKDFITEKLWEPILCESLVFYYGCPNVTDYIDSEAFVLLDIHDFEKSYQIIKKAIEEDWWSQRIDIIRKEKDKLLNVMGFFPRVEKIIQDYLK